MNIGVHTITVGDLSVTALHDGVFVPPPGIVTGVTQDEADTTLAAHFRPGAPVITVTAFLVRHPGGLALIDTGSADKFGPGHGRLIGNLETIGVAPADIGTILLTHAHVDHAGGLTGPDWKPLYPNAEIVLSEVERDFWLETHAPLPERALRSKALAQGSLAAYAGRIRGVADGSEGVAGIRLLALPGHTPGHSAWLMSSGAHSLLVWGDIVHMPGLQFARPDASVIYDIDPALAAESRRKVLDMVATDRLGVAGPHMDFPTFGHVERRASGYGFVADAWAP